jgi:hypothetical protein
MFSTVVYIVEQSNGETLTDFSDNLDAATLFVEDEGGKLFAVTCTETDREMIMECEGKE